MIKYTIAEKLFVTPIRKVFSGAYFGYSVVHEARHATNYEMCFTMNYNGYPPPFNSEVKGRGIKIDMGILNFRIKDRTQPGSNIELAIPSTDGSNSKDIIVPFDNSATALLLRSFKTDSVYEIKEYLLDLIQDAIARS